MFTRNTSQLKTTFALERPLRPWSVIILSRMFTRNIYSSNDVIDDSSIEESATIRDNNMIILARLGPSLSSSCAVDV
jgi:hypothetical protein